MKRRERDADACPGWRDVWAIYVSPEHLSPGVGRDLWKRARERQLESGSQAVGLWVLAEIACARRFNVAVGFEPQSDSAKKLDWGGTLVEEIRYVFPFVGFC